MKHTEKELTLLKEEVSQMWYLVLSQLGKSKEALLTGDKELALEVLSREKRVDTFELKIESDCENYIALYAPVAVDLRLVLSLIKISATLERIGDFAEGIARFAVSDTHSSMPAELVEKLQIDKMLDTVMSMLSDSLAALESENTRLAGRIMQKDDEVDELYHNAIDILEKHLKINPNDARVALKLLLIVRKIERIGDHCNNIVEEIVFYIDAKVLKHSNNSDDAKGDVNS